MVGASAGSLPQEGWELAGLEVLGEVGAPGLALPFLPLWVVGQVSLWALRELACIFRCSLPRVVG